MTDSGGCDDDKSDEMVVDVMIKVTVGGGCNDYSDNGGGGYDGGGCDGCNDYSDNGSGCDDNSDRGGGGCDNNKSDSRRWL